MWPADFFVMPEGILIPSDPGHEEHYSKIVECGLARIGAIELLSKKRPNKRMGWKMRVSLIRVFSRAKHRLGLAHGVDIRIFDKYTGNLINRRKEIEPQGFTRYMQNVDVNTTRVGSFCAALAKIIGAQVACRIEIWYAGRRVNGQLSLARLRA